MSSSVSFFAVAHCLRTLSLVAFDLVVLVALAARPRAALVAENLFLRKQLALSRSGRSGLDGLTLPPAGCLRL